MHIEKNQFAQQYFYTDQFLERNFNLLQNT